MSKQEIAVVVLIVMIIALFIAIPYYEWSIKWSDNGKIIWVGQKTFDPSTTFQWSYPFSVSTYHHGNFNFTNTGTYGPFACLSIFTGNGTKPILNESIGIYQNNYGCIELVIDP